MIQTTIKSVAVDSAVVSNIAEIVDEITDRLNRGERPDLDQYAQGDPQLRRALQQIVDTLDLLREPVSGSTSHEDQPTSTGQLGDFRILRELGRGGMGVVYEAEQISIGRHVALKVLPFAAMLDKQQLNRFKNEARAAGTLDHPNIVSVFSVGTERGVHYYAMQLIEGQSLAEVIAARRQRLDADADENPTVDYNPQSAIDTRPVAQLSTIPESNTQEYFRTVAGLGIQAAEALDHAHQNGIVHRDVKPGNLLVDAEGKLYVTDFGLARIEADAGMTMTGDLLGTLRYMSPEQALAKRAVVDHRTDIYSLGATLYELLALRPAYPATDRHELLKQIAFEEPKRLRKLCAKIPADLETIAAKCLEKEPADRYQSSGELAADLHSFLAYEPIKASAQLVWQRAAKWARRHVGVVYTALAASILLCIVLFGAVTLVTQSRTEAIYQQSVAEEAARTAEEQRVLAEHQRDLTLQQNYVSSIKLAHNDWNEGNLVRMSQTLQSLVPHDNLPDFRGWEWYFLASLLQQNENRFDPELGPVYQVRWSSDERLLAAAGKKGVKIVEPVSRHAVHSFPDWVMFDWQPRGSFIASLTRETPRRVIVWDVASNKEVCSTSVGDVALDPLSGHTGISNLKWSPDSNTLAWNYGRTLRIWDLREAEPKSFEYVSDEQSLGFRSLAWHPSGQYLYLGDTYPGGLVVWSTATSTFSKEQGIPGVPTDLAWNAQGERLAVATVFGGVQVLEPSKEVSEIAFDGFRGPTSSIAWSPKGNRLVAAGDDNLVRVWDLETRQQANLLAGHEQHVSSVDWAPISNRIVSCSTDGSIRFWNPDDRRDSLEIAGLNRFAWDPTGKLIATRFVAANRNSTDKADREYKVVNVETGQTVLTLEGRRSGGIVLVWSPDGRLIAANDDRNGIGRGSIGVWDAKSGRQVQYLMDVHFTPDSLYNECRSIAWSPDAGQFASGGTDTLVKIWETSTGKLQHVLNGHKDWVDAVLWSPDGRWLASADSSHNVKIWDALNWKLLWEMDLPETRESSGPSNGHSIAWSPKSDRLATRFGRGRLVVWNVFADRAPELAWDVIAHTSNIRCVDWSPQSTRIATFSEDRRIKIWNADAGRELLSIDVRTGPGSLAWSPDGQRLASSGPGKELLIWDASPAIESEKNSNSE